MTAPTPPRLEAVGLSKTFGHDQVLRGVDLTVAPGEVVSIIGPSGSGKSTLLRLLNHLEEPTAGVVRLDGELIGVRRSGDHLVALRERELRRQRARIGFVFQQFNLFPHLTALENIARPQRLTLRRGRQEALSRARTLLDRVGLARHADHYPGQLSGGQQQRVAIARTLALDPDLILFDEPTSALDPELVGEVNAVITELAAEGRTLVVVTHELAFARRIADRILFLDQGRVVAAGPPAAVLDHPATDRTRAFLTHWNSKETA
ncbi:ABC transporter related protein OS=Tsukamurella paurometabola (strain ATCC 8368 / DSM / CCUG 35730 / CIP 100753 / JCM 10117 / KCTC 9821 / NBRC 16120 / NCIMB 702349 / NCTC 13040) OX=521096 GN=Tpau_2051 PE=4 SV=1 [Tsukamurella paurometabola]|uniref:ABC transporter related protein n=1 Tax=Tsukamurella paurometabola (strain ATCC 8368 / DSM 20162 / CCUG 35730 / CIP 100753 / JCM 10117 / KCTC 9821 / NBRC 16120 / NCIMB 702349 / NCTC 13040) TaxID=521096 RepID=D5UNU5_TSUPD|nr:amino acid ABC transporter ATP-binding protein [Tsukamurella paurometabola]ADG78663.1 ABC transporter related protein [Tsukamurella paurometabola DSM 20162]SUP32626.1 L-cystine import ATP-binding protein TcyC [Tsukamurella paurometabola]